MIIGPHYRGRPKEKPRQWGPVSSVQSSIRDWFENKIGVAAPEHFWPFWPGGNTIYDYMGPAHLTGGTGTWNGSWLTISTPYTWSGKLFDGVVATATLFSRIETDGASYNKFINWY